MHRLTAVLCLLLLVSGSASAASKKISVALTFSVFQPSSGTTRDIFGSTWTGIGIGQFTRQRATKWHPTFDVNLMHHDDIGEATLVPVTFGMQRAFGSGKTTIPYAAVRVGPYYGRVRRLPFEDHETHIGFNANAAIGVTIKERYFLEARYDFFSRIESTDFDGVSLTAGVRVFDFKL